VEQVESGPAAIGGGGFGPGRGGSLPYVVGVRQRLRLWCALATSVSPVTLSYRGEAGDTQTKLRRLEVERKDNIQIEREERREGGRRRK
jgi:hypothetical protein